MEKVVKHTQRIIYSTSEDFKNAILFVSLVVNLFILTTWLVAKASTTYAAQIINSVL